MPSFSLDDKLCSAAASTPLVPKDIMIQLYIEFLIWLKMSPAVRGSKESRSSLLSTVRTALWCLKKKRKKYEASGRLKSIKTQHSALAWIFPHSCFTASKII